MSDSIVCLSANALFNEAEIRKAIAKAAPLRTLTISCYDPRAVGLADAVARAQRVRFITATSTSTRPLTVWRRQPSSSRPSLPAVTPIGALTSIAVAQLLLGDGTAPWRARGD
jgi:hypothetical protein